MSYFDDASLVMIPSGYKDQKVYSVKPIDGSGDLTFSRGSDIEATRVASNGYIEKAKVNLLLQSNSFTTTWTAINATLTSGQSGYDGSTDAWKLESSTNATESYARQTLSLTGVGTMSIYAKAGNVNFVAFYIASSGPDIYSWFNLSTGATGSGAGEIDKTITSVGGGWYRVTLTGLNPDQRVDVYAANANGSYVTNSGEYIYIQDAQINYGLVAQDYVETTTTSVVSGITNDLPRLDYSGGASCPSLLLEPSRQNLVAFSEYLNGSIWSRGGSSVTDNDTTSPEGVQNAAKLQGDGSQPYISLYESFTFPSTGNYTLSVYAKAGNNDFLRLQLSGVTGGLSAYYDLVNGTTAESYASIEAIGTNGWYRCSMTANLTGPDLTGSYNFYTSYSYTTSTFPSTGDANGQYVYLYGAQLESSASYPSSMIPTYGTSATRTGESCSKTGISSLIGQTEGTLFVEYDSNITEDDSFFLTIDDGTANNRVVLYSNTPNNLATVINAGGVLQTVIPNIPLAVGTNKFAVAYKANDIVIYLNGVQRGSDNSATIPATSAIRMGTDNTGAALASGKGTKQALLFKTRLSNSDLAALTSL